MQSNDGNPAQPSTQTAKIALVINCGSSSVKYQLIDLKQQRCHLKGLLENIGGNARLHLSIRSYNTADDTIRQTSEHHCPNMAIALKIIASTLQNQQQPFNAIVHRVVHGGERFTAPLRLTPQILEELKPLSVLAPLHNPANLQGIEACARVFSDVPQFAVFDTAFHATLPAQAYRYAIPNEWHALGVRRYGFHGSSHQYVAQQAAKWLNQPLAHTNLITLHLGNGASITAIEKGQSVDTSMGFTPLEGLIMGSRCGDLDAGIPAYIARATGLSPEALEHQLWNASGLRGLAGTHDMRTLQTRADTGDEAAKLAIDMYCYRAKKYVGAYLAALSHVDAIVFTGGIGENAGPIRAQILAGMQRLGIDIDPDRNQQSLVECKNSSGMCISSDNSALPVVVIATNEELEMANQAATLMTTT